jgi:DNA (cytosine-5)-methyltransferase 1
MIATVLPDNVVFLDQPKRVDNIVDLFCGCGGSGGGLLDATAILDRQVSGTFVNHWDVAIRVHAANHPTHRHLEEDLFTLDPTLVFPANTYCSLLWASPQCTFFSVARGASCVNEQDRSHAHSVTDWVRHLNPEAVIAENVKEFIGWGPTMQKRDDEGELMWARNAKPVKHLADEYRRRARESEADWSKRMLAADFQAYEIPDKTRKGEYFDLWMQEMKDLGFEADFRILKSADYGDPTIRARLFVYFVRKDTGRKIVWPEPYAGEGRQMRWRTARDIISWSIKGASVFTRFKNLADNTFRRLVLGLVKYGLRSFLIPNFGEAPRQVPRTHSVDDPLPTVTSHGAGGVVSADAYVIPHHTGSRKDYIRSVDQPVSTVTSTMTGEGLAQPAVQMVDHQRGTGVCVGVDEPLRALTAGGQHQAIAEAFMFAIDQTGGANKNDGTYPVDEPVRTLVTKANQTCIEVELEVVSECFLQACDAKGVDTSRATRFLGYLVDELKRHGKVDAKPWIYVYYSSGSEGKSIDEPLPTVRTKAGHALVYPVIELDGQLIRIDLFYRMLTPVELQRAMGFPDDMEWDGATKTQQIRAIGNSVSRGVARALGLAWYSQDPDVWPMVQHLYPAKEAT